MSIIEFGQPVITGFWGFLVQFIKWLTTISGSIALGVVLFTLALKLITLPFDYMSRASMRRNSVKMEEMRPELEKLQKQYADDKQLYNQKMMALYKRNGYSMFGSCLPMILSIVVFIIAINAFQDFSRYQNRQYFYEMACEYNSVIYSGLEVDGKYVTLNENGEIVVDGDTLLRENEGDFSSNGVNYKLTISQENNYRYFLLTSDNSYVIYKRYFSIVNDDYVVDGAISYLGNTTGLENNSESDNPLTTADGKNYIEFKGTNPVTKENETVEELFIKKVARKKSAEAFYNNGSKFIWIKNIWKPDSAFSNPIDIDFEDFKTANGYTGGMQEDGYSELTAELTNYKSAPNGYFILIIMTAGISLLHQIVSNKAQKAQMELQTVDGQGAQTQKMMMWMMPIMMAFFAFMYTAAFSIYIIINSVFSILTTFGINFIVDRQLKKENKTTGKKDVIRGRIYEPKEKPEEPKKKKKKTEQINKHDFLSGYGDRNKK